MFVNWLAGPLLNIKLTTIKDGRQLIWGKLFLYIHIYLTIQTSFRSRHILLRSKQSIFRHILRHREK